MTLEQAGELIKSGQLTAKRGDSWDLVWAKHTINDHALLMARTAYAEDRERQTKLIQERYDRAFALVLADLLSKE